MHVFGWIVAVLLMIVGLAGTVVPGLPGTVLIFAGLILGAWLDGFRHVGGLMIIVLGVLSVTTYIIDAVVVGIATKAVKASGFALAGATLGTFLGIFTGFIGLIFLPFVGAVLGEYIAQKDLARAGRVGVATWIGMALGVAGRIALGFTMIGVFILAFLWNR